MLSGEADLVVRGGHVTLEPVMGEPDHMRAGKAALIADPGEIVDDPRQSRLDRARGIRRAYAYHPLESSERGDGADIGVVLDLCEEFVSAREFARFDELLGEVSGDQSSARVALLSERQRACEQMHRGGHIAALACAPAGRVQVGGGVARERRVRRRAELAPVAHRLLEVPAGDLVELGQVAGAVLLEPAREPLVQLGAGRLRQAVVGGVADQQVAEAERVVGRSVRGGGGSAPCGRAREPQLDLGSRDARRRALAPPGGETPRPRPRRARAARAPRPRAGRAAPRAAPGSSAAPRPCPRSRASATISSRNSGLPSLAAITRAAGLGVEPVAELLEQRLATRPSRAARAARWSR